MNKILLIESEHKKHSQILKEFFQNLSPILNIKGFYVDKVKGNEQLQINLLSQRSKSFLLNLNRNQDEIHSALETFLELLINELSVFELVDIFLLDKLGMLEMHSPRLKQQIITVFSSRIPVIATVHQQDLQKLDYLLDYTTIKTLDLTEFDEQDMFSNLIRELYDL